MTTLELNRDIKKLYLKIENLKIINLNTLNLWKLLKMQS